MTRRHLTAVVAGVLTALLLPTAAWAEASAQIVQVDSDRGELRVVLGLEGLAPGDTVDLDSVQVTVDGSELEAGAEPVGQSRTFDQIAMLVIDTSGSMAGPGIAGAKRAAQTFLSGVPDDVEVGLVTFANRARVAVKPTDDRAAVSTAINGLVAQGSTALYDAVVLAATEVAPADLGTAIILSDGADEGSTATLNQATRAADRSEARFDAVSIGTASAQVGPLRTITRATGGSVATTSADAEALSALFDEAATELANQYLVTADIPAELTGTSATVTVSMSVGGSVVSDSAFVPIAQATSAPDPEEYLPEPVATGRFADIPESAVWLALGGIFVALVVLVGIAIVSVAGRDNGTGGAVKRRLSVYTLSGRGPVKEQETTALGDTQVARSAVDFAGRVVAQRDLETLVGGKLEAAGVPLKSAEWLLIHIGTAVGLGLLFLLLSGGDLLPALVGLGLGLLGPWMYLAVKESRRTSAFMAALPDTLQLIAGSLSAGYSMPQAIDTVVREGRAPISTEFNRALVEARLGVPIEDALDGIATRMRSVDFAWVVMAIKIQREVGGNLAEVLTTVAATLRERERLRRQVQVLSAEGRLSAWILGLLPVLFALYLVLVRPGYLEPLVTTVLGWLMVGLAVVLLGVGALWLRKVVKVEV